MKQDIDRLLIRTPNQKAREIAKALGKTRKEVNSFLYAHPEAYQKNPEHKWRLVSAPELELLLPTGWVTGQDFEAVLKHAGSVLNSNHNEIKFVFSTGCKTMIDCIARILALANQLSASGKGVTLDFSNAGATLTYLNRAGFFDILDKRVRVLPERPRRSAAKIHHGKSDTLVEFGGVDPSTDNAELIEQLTETFVQQSNDDYRIAAFTVFSELIGNVWEHSKSPFQGFAGLQKYSGRRDHIQTVVSDSGVGIAKTLRPALKGHYPSLYKLYGKQSVESDIGLVTAAMGEGGVSRFGGARGLGFESSRKQASKFDAQFSVRQERFCLNFIIRDGILKEVKQQPRLRSLPGTHICFDFYLD